MPASHDSGPAPKDKIEERPGPSSGKRGAGFDDEEDQWRHDPVAPKDEKNPLDSLGRSVSDVVTGPLDETAPPKPRG